MKVKQGVFGLEGNKYFVWKDWGPLAWWDFDEKDKKVVSLIKEEERIQEIG